MDDEDDVFLGRLLEEMAELESRPAAEIGVPMFLVPEDLAVPPGPIPDGDDPAPPDAVGAAFARGLALLEGRRGPLAASDLARLVEVLAHRAFGGADRAGV